MFADDAQISRCCVILLRRFRLPPLWTDSGPTSLALEWRERGPLSSGSSGEHLMLRACFDFWNGSGNVTVGELMTLDEGLRRAVTELIVASLNSRHVEEWIEKWD